MAQQIADRRDVDFVLYEQFETQNLLTHERYSDMNRKMFDMIVTEARKLAIKEILPANEEGDRVGIRFEDNRVIVPECYKRPYELMKEGEWIALTEDPEIGGQGLPHTVAQAVTDYFGGPGFSFLAFGGCAHGAAKMIEIFGTDEQKERYMRKMYAGIWGGTMVLTEAEAGSDLGALTTTAVKNEDGTYSITGNKIFITCGDHGLTENIIHPVLARIEGAPAGTKGISLFLVPKIWVNDDGSLGEANDVVCTGIEEKMGLHGSPTCQMAFGARGKCRGVLLGEENKGMKVMFHMMNEARLGIGAIGLGNASCAYLSALHYARERIQGRDLEQMFDKDAESVPIIRHPDVRRMLMWMKCHVEGMRSFVYYTANLFDKEDTAQTPEDRTYYKQLIDLLTPVIKSYCTDRGFECTVMAMQVYGGYGYTSDYPVERLLRDSKINSIYEGTNGIQAMDLLGRKMGMEKGAVFMNFINEVKQSIARAKETQGLEESARRLETALDRLAEVAMQIGMQAMSPDFKIAFSHASPFLEAMGDVIMGWMLLWRAAVAAPALEKLVHGLDDGSRVEKINKNKNAAFYDGQLKSCDYFIQAILPVTMGRLDAVGNAGKAVVDIPEAAFGAV